MAASTAAWTMAALLAACPAAVAETAASIMARICSGSMAGGKAKAVGQVGRVVGEGDPLLRLRCLWRISRGMSRPVLLDGRSASCIMASKVSDAVAAGSIEMDGN